MADTTPHDPSDVLHYHGADDRSVKHRSASPLGGALLGIIMLVAIGVLAFKLKHRTDDFNDLQAQLATANAETAAARSDLATAGTKSADLQKQLDQARSQQADFQAQLKKAEGGASDAQAQLTQAQAALKTQQDQSQTQLKDLQAQLGTANNNSASLRKELTAAQSQVADLKGQLDKAKADAAATMAPVVTTAPTRALPLVSEFKKAFFGRNFSLQLTNQGSETLNVDLQITGSDGTPSQTATITAGGTFKLDGITPGATITLASNGFESRTLTAQQP